MKGELKEKVARGVAWSMAEKAGSALLQMGVSIVVLRLLMPAEMGAWAILTAISAVALIVIDSGFSQTLIRKPDPTPDDYKSVFAFNVVMSLGCYALLAVAAFPLARFYDMPSISAMAPVFFLLLPVSALCVIQNTILTRQMRFALMSKVTFLASLVGGMAAVGMALAGWGLWSFVGQRVVMAVVKTALMWWLSDWRPQGRYDHAALRRMTPFSMRLMTTDLISTIYSKLPQLIFGRIYPSDVLGYFDQAVKNKDAPLTTAMQSVQNVTYPALSKIGDNPRKFAESYRQIVMVVTFVLFPVMMGLSATAEEFFLVLMTEKWLPTVPYFRVICLTGLFYPVAMVAYNVLKVRCDGKAIVWLEVVKKVTLTAIFAVTIFHSVMAVVWGLVVMSLIEMCLNVGVARRFTELTIGRLLRTLLPVVLITAVMYAAVWGVGLCVASPVMRLFAKIAVGMVVYVGLSALFRLEAFREVMAMARQQLRKR